MELDEAALADLIRCRQMAEEAVSDMPEGPRKERAFEIFLGSLLQGTAIETPKGKNGKGGKRRARRTPVKEQASKRARAGALTHLRQLAEDGYFDEPRRLPEMVEELRSRGHLYNQPQISGAVLRATRSGLLRRIPEKDKTGREVFIYQKASQ